MARRRYRGTRSRRRGPGEQSVRNSQLDRLREPRRCPQQWPLHAGTGKGGAGTATFWAELQRNGNSTKSPKYSDPASNGDLEAKGHANCEKEVYTNGKVKFPPASTEEPWSEVTTKVSETNYALCGFTYDLSLNAFHLYPGTTEAEATTAENYFTFVLNTATEGGQSLINGLTDYLPLPTNKEPSKNVLTIAQKGAAKITF